MDGDIIIGSTQSTSLVDILTLLVSLAGVVILALYTHYTKETLQATKEALGISSRNLMLAHRSWLMPSQQAGLTFSDNGILSMTLVNKGGVPCIVGRSAVHGIIVNREAMPNAAAVESMSLDIPDERYMNVGVVVPQGEDYVLVSPMPYLAEGQAADVIVVYCHIEYRDVFEKTWTTSMAWRRLRGAKGQRWQCMEGHSKMT